MNRAIVGVYEFPLSDRYINIGVVRSKAKTRLEYSDDRGFDTIQDDGFAEYGGAAAEAISPEAVADDGHWRAAVAVFFRRKFPSQRKPHTERTEEG